MVIKVRDANNTYTARCNGKTASATSGQHNAAMAVAVKVMGGCPFILTELGRSEDKRVFLFELDEVQTSLL
jgi:hypothetical protein